MEIFCKYRKDRKASGGFISKKMYFQIGKEKLFKSNLQGYLHHRQTRAEKLAWSSFVSGSVNLGNFQFQFSSVFFFFIGFVIFSVLYKMFILL